MPFTKPSIRRCTPCLKILLSVFQALIRWLCWVERAKTLSCVALRNMPWPYFHLRLHSHWKAQTVWINICLRVANYLLLPLSVVMNKCTVSASPVYTWCFRISVWIVMKLYVMFWVIIIILTLLGLSLGNRWIYYSTLRYVMLHYDF